MNDTQIPAEASADRREGHAEREHLVREAYTMALYVAIVLLAALAAVAERGEPHDVSIFALVWGTTVGLALAHWLAFNLAARFAAGGEKRREHFELAAAQLLGAFGVALVVTIPIVFLPASSERMVVRFELAALIGVIAFLVARTGGGGRIKSLTYAFTALMAAVVVATLKNVLSGH